LKFPSKGWIGSSAYGFEGLSNLPSAIAIDLYGSRKVALFGAFFQTLGLLTSAFVNILPLYFLTFSVIFGVCRGILLQATYQILPHYFDKNLGIANGMMNFGGSLISVIYLYSSNEILNKHGLKYFFIIFACLSTLTILAAASFKSVLKSESDSNNKFSVRIKQSLALTVLKRREFTIWWVSSLFSIFSIITTLVTIVSVGCCGGHRTFQDVNI
jgi:MCP family monocarboxylic acid transporter-like MFS transporter 2